MINVLIVDDEPLALDILETYIEQIPNLNLIKRCENALEARDALKEHSIDLMFLDIQMPQITGIDFVKTLANPPLVVFTTAYPNFAIEGFELNALDYLLKPVSFERFNKAVNKAMEKLDINQSKKQSQDSEEAAHDYIFVKADKKFVKVKYSEIIYVEGLKDYVIIRTLTGRVITLQTMKSLEDKLPHNMFMRIHRSYIVNIDKINAVVGNMVEVTERNEVKQLPVGKNYRDDLTGIINDNKL
ncbi:MAG: response regulator transcription factor [Saprospiraceae bacterium]|jgi:DNA-binding LytR/AlgR family response regulator|nr:response regulator transcription factor [Saprospiraceae bacterium]